MRFVVTFAEMVTISLLVVFSPGIAFALDATSLIAGSDDLERHRDSFAKAASWLVEDGPCTKADFVENGGWVRSTRFGSRAVYFTYCGGPHVNNRIYLDAKTGEIFQ